MSTPDSIMPSHQERARRFVARVHGLRTLGLGLGFLPVAAALHVRGAPMAIWVLLVTNAFIWPHVARVLAERNDAPVRAEHRSLLIDSAMGGVWVALMQFSVLPSVALATMLATDKIAVGGTKLMARGVALQALACALVAAVNGFAFAPTSGMFEIVATIPFLIAYPTAIAMIMYRLSQRVRRQNRTLARLGSIDRLSDLLNRGHWEEAVALSLEQYRFDGIPAVLLMIDVDHFKHINDRHGHTVGDAVIARTGAIIRRSLREGDIAGRYGGDEFGIVLRGVDAAAAAVIAERIRAGVAAATFEYAQEMHCTLSIGLAQVGPEIGSALDWIRSADAALYRAKVDGRDRLASVV